MLKDSKRKNVYVYFTAKDFRYLSVEAIDDNGNRFLYTLDDVEHDAYLCSAKDMCDRFEKFCKNLCGLNDSRYCDIWAINFFSPIPIDFEYNSLFDIATIHTREYGHCFDIYDGYREHNLDTRIGRCDYACCQYLSTQYSIKCSHIETSRSFSDFLKKYFTEKTADGVKSTVTAYKKFIDKTEFTVGELKNIEIFMLKNIDVIFDHSETTIMDTREKFTTEFALAETAIRLYIHDKTAFKAIIHILLDKPNTNRRRAYSDVYNFILHYFEDYYEEFCDTSFEGVLSDITLPPDFCSQDDMLKIREMIFYVEGK